MLNIIRRIKNRQMVKISKTYVPKLTEKYMCEKHKAYFKKKLNEWKIEIIRSNNEALYNGSLDDNSTSADIVDQASSYTDKTVEMKAINRQIKLISKIDQALNRIKDNTYGFCAETGKRRKGIRRRHLKFGYFRSIFKKIITFNYSFPSGNF